MKTIGGRRVLAKIPHQNFFLLVGMIFAIFLLPLLIAGQSIAQSCSNEVESEFAERALNSQDFHIGEQYLLCFNYSDQAPIIRRHVAKLRQENACSEALASDDIEIIRRTLIQLSGTECAIYLGQRLKELQRVEFIQFGDFMFLGTPFQSGETDNSSICEEYCREAEQKCVGYTFQNENRECKNWSAITGREPTEGVQSGAIHEVPINEPEVQSRYSSSEFNLLYNFDLPGGNFTEIPEIGNYKVCQERCSDQSNCAAFSFNRRSKVCFLKDRTPSQSALSGVISGSRAN